MAKTQILDFYIHTSDKTKADQYNAFLRAGNSADSPAGAGKLIFVPRIDGPDTYPGGGFVPVGTKGEWCINKAPYNAGPPEGGYAVEWAIILGVYPPAVPVVEVGEAAPANGNYLDSPWFTNSNDFPRNVATFTRSSGWWIFGSSTRFYWAGHVVYTPKAEVATPGPDTRVDVPAKIRNRRWIDGMESTKGGDNVQSDNGTHYGFFAGRHVGSYGYARHHSTAGTRMREHDWATGTKATWERFYLTWFPGSAEVDLWKSEYAATAASGPKITLTGSGQLACYQVVSSVTTLITTMGQLVAGVPVRIDLINTITSSGSPGNWECEVFLNGQPLGTFNVQVAGLEINFYMTLSRIGKLDTGISSTVWQIDNWIGGFPPRSRDKLTATWLVGTPYVAGDYVKVGTRFYIAVQSSTGVDPATDTDNSHWQRLKDPTDWVNGSKVVNIYPSGNAASFSGWAGPADYRVLNQRPVGQSTLLGLTSSTALAQAHFTTDIVADAEAHRGALGWNSFQVQPFSRRGTTSGQVGYKLGAGAPVMANVTEQNFLFWSTPGHVYAPSPELDNPVKGQALEIRFNKGNDASSATLGVLTAAVELCGIFGPEDVPPGGTTNPSPPPTEFGGLQNSAYPLVPWVTGQVPFAPVIYKTGSYVGNGTAQDLAFPAPVLALWIRPGTLALEGVRWASGWSGPHLGDNQGIGAFTNIVRTRQDFAFVSGGSGDDQQMRFLVTVGGDSTDVNASGQTFHYLAIMDPAGRFWRSGSAGVGPNELPKVHALDDPYFTPELALALYKDEYSTTSTGSQHHKGPAESADEIRLTSSGGAVANALTFGTGSLTFRAGFVSTDGFAAYSYLLLRRNDGNTGLDVRRIAAMGSYVGDGAASRTISHDMAGRRPMWGIVFPSNTFAHYRDTGHTGVNSSSLVNNNVTTAITGGGIDSFSVGTTLNSNGVTYTYLMIPGSATAGSGGWSGPSEEVPVPSDSPRDPDWMEPEILDPPTAPTTPVTLPDDMTTDLAATCIPATTSIANKALSALGVTTLIGNLSTEQSREAEQVRLHWGAAVEETLRRHPWGFAKRYALLTLVGGTVDVPYNEDWHYAYRLPAKCVRVRRVVNEAVGREFEPDPPHFAVSSDDTSDTIQSNALLLTDHVIDETAVALQVKIEYTHRINCPAGSGDALFRRALMWKLAELIGPGLSRSAELVQSMLLKFERTLLEGAAVTTDERQLPAPGEASWMRERD